MNLWLGVGNSVGDYAAVLGVYAAMFILMRYANRTVAAAFRKTRVVLGVAWGIGVFVGNYLFYLIGIMSFLPWLNNALHTFVWIGVCLSFLYAGCYTKPLWEQVLLFVIFSFIVKVAERSLLGTWELEHFFFVFKGKMAYIIGWSLMDGLYPFISKAGLRFASRFLPGLVVP